MQQPRPGLYRHFKGIRCVVLGVSKHSETKEPYVVYLHDNQMWHRPLEMFMGTVTREGKTVPRFVYEGPLDYENKDSLPVLMEYLSIAPYMKEDE